MTPQLISGDRTFSIALLAPKEWLAGMDLPLVDLELTLRLELLGGPKRVSVPVPTKVQPTYLGEHLVAHRKVYYWLLRPHFESIEGQFWDNTSIRCKLAKRRLKLCFLFLLNPVFVSGPEY